MTYTPDAGFTGVDQFQFKVCDKTGICDIATVYVVVTCASGNFAEGADFYNLDVGGTKEGGLTWADFNNDGFLDVLVNTTDGGIDSRMIFSKQQGSLTFEDVTTTHADGLTNNTLGRTALAGDLNNDGYIDFVRNTFSRIEVFYNKGPNANPAYSFGDADQDPNIVITAIAGGMNVEGMTLSDWNQDGWLDLVFDYDNNGSEVFENDKDGTFTLQTPGTGAGQTGFPASLGDNGDYAATADWDNDGFVDVIFRKDATDANGVDLWNFNESTGRFTAVTSPNIQAAGGNKGAVTFCDLDNDADLDFIWTDGAGNDNKIYTNSGGTFTLNSTLLVSGSIDECDCADVDNDGDLDIFLGDNSGTSYLYINNGSLSFTQTNGCLNPAANAEAAEFVDFDKDGDMDLYINIAGGGNQLWVNAQNDENYLFVEPRIKLPNGRWRSALGANVLLTNCDDDTLLLQEVSGGRGHGSQKPGVIHFGLGTDGPDEAYTAIVYFPDSSGTRDTVSVNFVPSQYDGQKLIVYQSSPDNENCADLDGDGVIDIADIDTDGDGILNDDETPLGNVSPYVDSDFDGTYDYLDEDFTGCGTFTNGVCSNFDSDGDGVADFLDLDSDNDGLTDVREAGGIDSNGDGIIDNNNTDTDGDGYPNSVDSDNGGTALSDSDSDGDGVPNRSDADSDADGIPDLIEVQTTAAYSGLSGSDTDGDGIDDRFDVDCSPCGGVTGSSITPTNTDGTDEPDYLDDDSDNDGISDNVEAYDDDYNDVVDVAASGIDSDADGIDDSYDDDGASATNGAGPGNNQTPASFLDTRPSTTEKNWREARLPVRSGLGSFTVTSSCPTISGTDWIDVDDGSGNIVFSINPNGNNLGSLCWGVNILSGVPAVRIDTNGGYGEYILNRNFYLDPTSDPSSSVDLRFYSLTSEINDLRTAANNDGFNVGTFQSFIDDSLNITQSEPTPLNLDVTDNGAVSASLKNPSNQEYTASGYGINISSDDLGEFVPFFTPRLPNVALPLNLLSFEVKKQDQEVDLHWIAISSTSIELYQIERSQNLIDWMQVGIKKAVGLRGERSSYKFTDEHPIRGTSYYRLKAVDINGDFEYSGVRQVSFDSPEESQTLLIYPNPTNGSFQIHGLPNSVHDLKIIDMQGKLVYSDLGRNKTSFNGLIDLAPGVYQVQIIGSVLHSLPLIVR